MRRGPWNPEVGHWKLGPMAPGEPLGPWALGAPGSLGHGAFGALLFDGFCHPRRPLRVIIGARPCLQLGGPLDSMAPRRGIAKDMALAAARATFCASLAQKNITLGASFALHVPVPLRYRVTFSLLPPYLYLILQNRSRPCRLPKTTELLRIVF